MNSYSSRFHFGLHPLGSPTSKCHFPPFSFSFLFFSFSFSFLFLCQAFIFYFMAENFFCCSFNFLGEFYKMVEFFHFSFLPFPSFLPSFLFSFLFFSFFLPFPHPSFPFPFFFSFCFFFILADFAFFPCSTGFAVFQAP